MAKEQQTQTLPPIEKAAKRAQKAHNDFFSETRRLRDEIMELHDQWIKADEEFNAQFPSSPLSSQLPTFK